MIVTLRVPPELAAALLERAAMGERFSSVVIRALERELGVTIERPAHGPRKPRVSGAAVLQAVEERPGLSLAGVSEATGGSIRSCSGTLLRLVQAGKLRFEGRTKGRRYYPAQTQEEAGNATHV